MRKPHLLEGHHPRYLRDIVPVAARTGARSKDDDDDSPSEIAQELASDFGPFIVLALEGLGRDRHRMCRLITLFGERVSHHTSFNFRSGLKRVFPRVVKDR